MAGTSGEDCVRRRAGQNEHDVGHEPRFFIKGHGAQESDVVGQPLRGAPPPSWTSGSGTSRRKQKPRTTRTTTTTTTTTTSGRRASAAWPPGRGCGRRPFPGKRLRTRRRRVPTPRSCQLAGVRRAEPLARVVRPGAHRLDRFCSVMVFRMFNTGSAALQLTAVLRVVREAQEKVTLWSSIRSLPWRSRDTVPSTAPGHFMKESRKRFARSSCL